MKKNLMYIMMLILLVSLLAGCSDTEVAVETEDFVPIELGQAQLGDLTKTATFLGTLSPGQVVNVMPMIATPEEVEEVYVEVGDEVSLGDQLVRLSGESVEKQIESARLAYELSLSSYRNNLANFENAKENLKRMEALYAEGAISKSEYDQAKLMASDTQLALMQDQLDQAKFAYENAKDMRDDLTLKAPVAGIVTEITLSENNVASSQNMITIMDFTKVEAAFFVPEKSVNDLKTGHEVTVEVLATGDELVGEIMSISASKDPRTNMYKVMAQMETNGQSLRGDMRVKVYYRDLTQQVVLLPIDAVLFDNEGNYVYVYENDALKIVPVEMGDDNGEMVEILSGLSTSDKVVIKGQNFIKADTPVKVVRGE